MEMKKKLLLISLLSPNLYAGTLGAADAKQHMLFSLYEAAYSWPSNGNLTINNQETISPSQNGWGGRAAVGAMLYPEGPLKYSIEAGWGYYNKASYKNLAQGVNSSSYLYGFDILAGPNWNYQNINLFFKLGMMLENLRTDTQGDLAKIYLSPYTQGTPHSQITSTTATPELKVGGIYEINEHLGISLAYMYVFGNNTFYDIERRITPTSANTENGIKSLRLSSATKGYPVEMSSIMFGLQYRFA